MNFQSLINDFLKAQSKSCGEVYGSRIQSFYDFITRVKGINNSSFSSYITNMNTEEIIESLDYFIGSTVNKESVAWHYISVIVKFFQFLALQKIENINILKEIGLNSQNDKSFYYKINKKISADERLEKVEAKEALDINDIKILIDEMNNIIDNLINNSEELFRKKTKQGFNDLTAALCIKLMIYTGAKYDVVKKITRKGYDEQLNKIKINKFNIHLPDVLANQLRDYVEYRDKIDAQSDKLFIQGKGKELGRGTVRISRLMKVIGRGDTTGIIKFTIIEMIKSNINQKYIMKLTDAGDEIYNYCQNKVDEQNRMNSDRYMDSKLRSVETFDYL